MRVMELTISFEDAYIACRNGHIIKSLVTGCCFHNKIGHQSGSYCISCIQENEVRGKWLILNEQEVKIDASAKNEKIGGKK